MSGERAEAPRGPSCSVTAGREQSLQLWSAWALLALFTLIVLLLGGEGFSAARTYRWFVEVVHFFRPQASSSDIWFLFLWTRKLAHAAEYGLLALFAFRAARLSLQSPLGRVVLFAGLFTALVATADEFRQSTLGNRTGSLLDVWIDIASAIVALGLLLLLRARRMAAAETSGNTEPDS